MLTERALELCKLPHGSTVADIGCGAGGTLEYLEQSGDFKLVGLDSSNTLLDEAASRLVTVRLVQGHAERLPFKDNSFDALFCECVLSVIDDKLAALNEFERVLIDGGFLILSDVFNKGICDQGSHPYGLLTQAELIELLTERGFTILQWESHELLLKEFVVRMILAGERLPDVWGGCAGSNGKNNNAAGVGYFLMVARKSMGALSPE